MIENICAALSNLAYRNNRNQAEMHKNGTLALCISSLSNRAGCHFNGFIDAEKADGVNASAAFPCRPLELSAAVLNIVINAVDANPANQRSVEIKR